MPEPRGPTGTIRGLPAERVEELLLGLVEHLGECFTRQEVLNWLREQSGLSPGQVEGMAQAVDRLPGVWRLGEGERRLPPEPKKFVRNRHWRSALVHGEPDPEPAQALIRILEQHEPDPHVRPDLWALRSEIQTALRSVDHPEGAAP